MVCDTLVDHHVVLSCFAVSFQVMCPGTGQVAEDLSGLHQGGLFMNGIDS